MRSTDLCTKRNQEQKHFIIKSISGKVHGTRSFPTNFMRILEMHGKNAKILIKAF